MYHYAGNNPVRYVDPDGRADNPNSIWWNYTGIGCPYSLKIDKSNSGLMIPYPTIDTYYISLETRNKIQQEVINNPVLQQGQKGPWNNPNATDETTWCNVAAYFQAKQLSTTLLNALLNKKGQIATANEIYDNFVKLANDPNSTIVEVTPRYAQILANKGYIVFGVRKAPIHGHIASVSNSYSYDNAFGPMIENLGGSDLTGYNYSVYVFRGSYEKGEVKFFYDVSQILEK